MTLAEIRSKVAESRETDQFNSLELNLNFHHIDFSINLKGITSIYEFVSNQSNGWSKIQDNLPEELLASRNLFNETKYKIIQLINEKYSFSINNDWNETKRKLENENKFYFHYESAELGFLIKVYNSFPDSFIGAYRFIINQIPSNLSNKNDFVGSLMAYEFTLKDYSKILERRNEEKASISKIRNDFLSYLTESETQISEYIKNTNLKYNEYVENIDEFQKEKEGSYNDWFKEASGGFDQFKSDSDSKIKELEELYREKLKLEAPAKYWSDRAKKLRTEGYRWLGGLLLMVVVGIGMLIWSLSEISNGTLARIFQNSGTAIKWSVVFITLISFIAFAIRIFSKLTFSSFHLVRDAEEREQLTYVYLALQNKKERAKK